MARAAWTREAVPFWVRWVLPTVHHLRSLDVRNPLSLLSPQAGATPRLDTSFFLECNCFAWCISFCCTMKWINSKHTYIYLGFPGGASAKEPTSSNAGDVGLIPGLGRSPGGGLGNPLQYPCLENPMVRGAWQAAVHGVSKSWTQLKRLPVHGPLGPLSHPSAIPPPKSSQSSEPSSLVL